MVFVLFFDTHFQMPILAPFARTLGASPFVVGSIVGVYSLFNILGNVVSGHVIDSKCWKTPVTAGILAITLSLFAYALAPSPFALFLVRAFHGAAGGLVIPATLIYLTKTPLQTNVDGLSRRMSLYGVSIGLASLTGPPLGGLLASLYGYQGAYLVIGCLMVFAAFLIIFYFRGNEIPVTKTVSLRENYKKIMRSPLLRTAFKSVFALMGATGTLVSFLPFKTEALGASPAVTGGLFSTFAAVAVAVQLFWPLISERFKLLSNVRSGFFFLIISLVLIHWIDMLFPLFFALGLYGLGFGLLFPALLELVARGSELTWRGLATGFFFVFFSLGVALVPPFAGLLEQTSAPVSSFLTAAFVSIFIGGLLRLGD